MRADYFRAGPPWKAIFKDNKGFIHQTTIRDKKPPEIITFPTIERRDQQSFEGKVTFKRTGVFGNIVRYEQI